MAETFTLNPQSSEFIGSYYHKLSCHGHSDSENPEIDLRRCLITYSRDIGSFFFDKRRRYRIDINLNLL